MTEVGSATRRTLRSRLHDQLDPGRRSKGLSWLNRALVVLILGAVAVALLETERSLRLGYEVFFRAAELTFAALFAVEYAARFWTAAEEGGWPARWRWMVSPAAIIDLLAIAPAIFTLVGAPTYLLRLVRLLRILRVAKLGRFSHAWNLAGRALASRRYELLLALYAALFVMIVSATLLYLVEGPGQPEKFGSIPRALWWSVVTLTTIGYGDVYPETALGRVLAGITAMLGIGLIAIPTGILAAAFSDALEQQRREGKLDDDDL
ncbi:MAG: potassium channel family protein [Pseudomonadota bacterium]|jgi:voltage-gated potassium channel